MRVAHAGHNLGAVGFDFHSPATAVPLLPPPQLAVDGLHRNGYAGRESGQRRHEALSVGLPGGLKTQHSTNVYPSRLEHFAALLRILWRTGRLEMVKFLLWCILLILCWPLALLALVIYPFVWLLLLPFRLVGIAVGGVLALVWALVTLPARVLRGFA